MRGAPRRSFRGKGSKLGSSARKRVDPKDAGEVEWNPASDRSGEMEIWSQSELGRRQVGDTAQLGREYSVSELSTGSPAPEKDETNDTIVHSLSLSVRVPPSPSLSAQAPSPPSLSAQAPPWGLSFVKNCTQLREPEGAHGNYDYLTYSESYRLCYKRGCARLRRHGRACRRWMRWIERGLAMRVAPWTQRKIRLRFGEMSPC